MERIKSDLDDEFWEEDDEDAGTYGIDLNGSKLYFDAINGQGSAPFTVRIHRGQREFYEIFIAPWAMFVEHFKDGKKTVLGGSYDDWARLCDNQEEPF